MKNSIENEHERQLNDIKHEFYQFDQNLLDKYGADLFLMEQVWTEVNVEWNDFIKKIEQKVDGMLSQISSTHELYLNFLLIRACCVIRAAYAFMELGKSLGIAKSVIEMKPIIVEYRKLLQPFKYRAEGIWIYMVVQALYGEIIRQETVESSVSSTVRQIKGLEALLLLENARKSYKDFVKYKTVKPWLMNDIFCCYDAEGNQLGSCVNLYLYPLFDTFIDLTLMELALQADDDSKVREYGIPGLKIMLQINGGHKQLHDFVQTVYNIFLKVLQNNYYQQAQHLASVAMCKIVEFRRALPPAERTTVNPIQYEASFLYVQLATYLLTRSAQNIFDQKDPKNTTNHECIRLMSESDILSQYESVYPSDLVQNVKDLDKVKKKAHRWIKRMNELKETNTASPDLCYTIAPEVERGLAYLFHKYYS